MKYVLCALSAAVISAAAYACTTQTLINADGKFVVCTTCCDSSGNCNTTCI